MDDISENVKKIKSIFEEYYGEDRVDLSYSNSNRSYYLIVWFPRVIITNEYNKSTIARDLYIRVTLDRGGFLIGTFGITKATYSYKEWCSGYLHSHVLRVSPQYSELSSLRQFQTPCLGSGPIRGTCTLLNQEFDEDRWRLFAFELDKYIHTESVSGVPYIKLETIGKGNSRLNINGINTSTLKFLTERASAIIRGFIPYLISRKPFSFNYRNGYYGIAMSREKCIIRVSNLLIDYVNSLPRTEGEKARDILDSYMSRCKFSEGRIYILSNNIDSSMAESKRRELNGGNLFKFKDNYVTLRIDKAPEQQEADYIRIIEPSLFSGIMYNLLSVINKYYGTAK